MLTHDSLLCHQAILPSAPPYEYVAEGLVSELIARSKQYLHATRVLDLEPLRLDGSQRQICV
jgi:hypothetical protein